MFSDPQFWVAIAFIIFVIAVFNPIKKTIRSSLDTKINEIKDSIEEAENLKNETQITLSSIKKRQNEVEQEIKEIHFNAKEKITIQEIEANTRLKEQMVKRELIAKSKIDQITRDANQIIQQNISKTAIKATLSIIGEKLDQEEKQNLIDQSLKELSNIIKN